jgi:biopolymer transport protein ExbD
MLESKRNHEIGNSPATSRSSFTTSFGLAERIPHLKVGFDLVAVIDLLAIALLVGLLFTRFVVLPGIRVDLPVTDLRMPQNATDVAVLTIGNNGMLFFSGGVYRLSTVDEAFRRYIDKRKSQNAVVLLKTEATIDLQMFLELCQMAQAAGFAQVQISGQKAEAISGGDSIDLRGFDMNSITLP